MALQALAGNCLGRQQAVLGYRHVLGVSITWFPSWLFSYSFLLFCCRFEWAFLRQHKNYNRQLDQEEFMADLKADGYIAPDTNMKAGAYGRSVTV